MGEKIAIITLAFFAAIGIYYIVLAFVELARQRRGIRRKKEKAWYKFLEFTETVARLAEERKKNDQDGSRPGKESRRMIDDERRKAKREAVAVLQKWLRCARYDGTVPISMKEANPELARAMEIGIRAIREDLRREELFFSETAKRLLSRYEKEEVLK